jgi:parallel beta-helix repeat protein
MPGVQFPTISRTLLGALALAGTVAGSSHAQLSPARTEADRAALVHVAAPTGMREVDRASIVAALARVQPGGTVHFAAGTYLVGEVIPVPTGRIALQGHPAGTVLRGCEPAEYEAVEREFVAVMRASGPAEGWPIVTRCGMLELTGGHVTVRDLTFEYSRMGILLGCCHHGGRYGPAEGGYLIENNTFRNSGNAVRAILASPEPTVIRSNRFVNAFHALSAFASHLHFLDNEITVPEPEAVPGMRYAGFAVAVGPLPPEPEDAPDPSRRSCEHNVIAGNRIDGYIDGIVLIAEPGTRCTNNVIRENTISVRRVPYPEAWPYAEFFPLADLADSSFVGVPLILAGGMAISGPASDAMPPAVLADNLIEGNRILGADGIGIELVAASRNRIVNNTIRGIRARDPFPGNSPGFTPGWQAGNGSAIWISPGSEENEILDNRFEEIAADAVVLEGANNRVQTRGASDRVRDLGVGNRVSRGVEAVN